MGVDVPLTVADHLYRAEHVYRDRVGIIDEPDQLAENWGELTYGEVAARARAQAAALDRLEIGFGERVAVVSQNSARLLVSFFGVSAFGRILVPINFRLSADEVRYIVEHCQASLLLVDPELEDHLAGVNCRRKLVIGSETDEELYDFDAEPVEWEANEAAVATINYTSGTTARPKGVQMSHRNLWVNAAVFGWQSSVSDRDVYLHTLPMFHCNGWGMPYAVTAMGGRHIVLRKVDGTEILRRVQDHGVTSMCGAPAVANAILDALPAWLEEHGGDPPGAGETRVVVAGAPPPTKTIERVEAELGWEFIQIYGLTETSPMLTMSRSRAEWDALDSQERAKKLGRAGAPVLGVRLRTDEHDEVLARGAVVMEGYWDQPDATAEAIRHGEFHTGDGGSIDEEGYLTISDRKKDVIISGGENVSSIEVEDVLFSHPGVAEVAVVGVPDEKWGETVKAVVVRADGPEGEKVSEEKLIAYCRERLAHFKCPTSVDFVDHLARTATGKLQKFKIRAPYWEGREKQVN